MAGKPLKMFLNKSIETTSWATVLAGLEENPFGSYLAYERDDDGPLTALSYRCKHAHAHMTHTRVHTHYLE
jgi:hypothetical protein